MHYRLGGNDGVALEIDKRKDVLIKMGYKVTGCAGQYNSYWKNFVIPELSLENKLAFKIKNNSFFELKDYKTPAELMEDINKLSNVIEKQVKEKIISENYDCLLVNNIFSHARHIAAAKAVYNAVKETGINVIATHHDFYWERKEFSKPTCQEIKEFLAEYVPPQHPLIKHIVINNIARNKLDKNNNIKADVVPDTFDFNQKPWQVDEYNRNFTKELGISSEDIVLLQATRIVPRKGIELAIDLVTELNSDCLLKKIRGKKLYNGKKVGLNGKFVLALAGKTELESGVYYRNLIKRAKRNKVLLLDISNRIEVRRSLKKGIKNYSLWDSYVYSDAVTYPSLWEGWGNQFIEAVFAKKPIVLFEYPVFKSDIKPEGYEYITLGDKVQYNPRVGLLRLPKARRKIVAKKLIAILLDNEKCKKMTDTNFVIGKRNHSYDILYQFYKKAMKDI